MNALLATAFLASLTLVVLLLAHHRKKTLAARQTSATPEIFPVDLIAFQNLMSPSERTYLREHLHGSEFRVIQRARTRAAMDYVGRIHKNAKLLVRIGESAIQSSNPQVVAAGETIHDLALRTRAYALLTMLRLYLELLFPQADLNVTTVLHGYRDLQQQFDQFRRFDFPGLIKAES